MVFTSETVIIQLTFLMHAHSRQECIGGGTSQGMCNNYRGLLAPWTAVARIRNKAQTAAAAKSAAAQSNGTTAVRANGSSSSSTNSNASGSNASRPQP
jgi:hypothetical protein